MKSRINNRLKISYLVFAIIIFSTVTYAASPVFKNPGIPSVEYFEIWDRLDNGAGYITAKINVTVNNEQGNKYYSIKSNEGGYFYNDVKIRFDDLTTINEKRTDLKTGTILESFDDLLNGKIHYTFRENKIDKQFTKKDNNIYTRFAFFMSFRGFPFEQKNEVKFQCYIGEYGNALTMRVANKGKQTVKVRAGTFECYKLELSVAGWQSMFSSDKFYLYFSTARPYHFVRYDEKNKDGNWYSNELIQYKGSN